jgi:signal peptidase I
VSPFSLLNALAQEDQATGGVRGFIDSAARTPLSQVLIAVAVLTILRMAIYPYLRNTAPHQRYGVYSFVRLVNEVLDAIIYAGVFVFMIIRPFGVQAFLIPSGSMWPTLQINDIVVFRPPIQAVRPDQIGSDGQVNVDFIKRCVGTPGDIVELRQGVLYRNGKAVPDPYKHFSSTTDYVNFDDLPADKVAEAAQASFKWVKWHGQIIPLNYTATEANAAPMGYDNSYAVAQQYVIADHADQMKAIAERPEPLPPGDYMMMGDNRNNSFDSRGWGMVSRDAIIGRSEFIWLPIDQMGVTR